MLKFLVIIIVALLFSRTGLCAASESDEHPVTPTTHSVSAAASSEWDTLSSDSQNSEAQSSQVDEFEEAQSYPQVSAPRSESPSFDPIEFILGDSASPKSSGRNTPAPWTGRYLDRGSSKAVHWN